MPYHQEVTEEVVKDVNYLDFKNTFTYNTAEQGYSVDYQMKFLNYICYQEKRGTDEIYDIIQTILYTNAAGG